MNNSQILELASNLAHNRTLHELDICSENPLIYTKNENGDSIYKQGIQNEFNIWYEYYLDEINKVINE